ncbi:30S ribosome-binding factor RbfA [Alkalibacterium kapii]|uniref:Ribosome-binding factor A n=1 Tax=Alkalibacterium kapii TaxID=426704 RepID=A0A511AT46_9LACT|nr:30S ribosome-binding factor RbfA [Alkalibacterium kapii]GEK90892.1 ribosome-binding factor A [Alkalibacterium kapii]
MPNYRVGRVSQEIQKEVTDILLKRVRDPRVEGVTVTGVDVTGDLQQATVFYSTLSDDEESIKETQTGLIKATGLIKKELGSRLSLYKTPELIFSRDESVAYGSRIDQLLNEIKEEQDE